MKLILAHGKRTSDRADQFFEFGLEVGSNGNVAVSQLDLVSFNKFDLGERHDKGFMDPGKLFWG